MQLNINVEMSCTVKLRAAYSGIGVGQCYRIQVPESFFQVQDGKLVNPFHFSFQHQMSLTRDATQFADRVENAPISGNIDNPEGGLDALMQVKDDDHNDDNADDHHDHIFMLQVMVCDERIGWRKDARRVIIYTTDQVRDDDDDDNDDDNNLHDRPEPPHRHGR